MLIDKTITNPGFHRQFRLERFGSEEKRILDVLSRQWYMTSSGAKLKLAASRYDYFLMKPTKMFTEMFNIERELIVVFSPYPNFEPRTLDVFDEAQKQLSELRVESVCRVLVSQDPTTEQKVSNLLKTDPERPIVIPLTYDELLTPHDDYFVRNRFRSHFYSRDLFSFLSPLRRDLYFFGRNQLLQEIVNKHRAGEHTGLFGLRKSGKTSIIFAVERHLTVRSESYVSIDCENPAIHGLRWFELLEHLAVEFANAKNAKRIKQGGDRYNEKRAAASFAADVLKSHKTGKKSPVLLMFDEIERISPRTGSSDHWRNGDDFVYLWQTLRGFYQRHQDIYTYMLVGTNPACVEAPIIGDHENPLFGSVPAQYVPCFSVDQTREMVRKLGRYMGLRFDELLYAKLVEDFGGHPFVIRQFCSEVHRTCKGDRPIRVDRVLYNRIKKSFRPGATMYLEMIVSVLRDWYPDEYDMLRFLAQGDDSTFEQLASDSYSFIRHLVGYGLISQSDYGYGFNIEYLREYMTTKHQYERLNLTDEEKVSEISVRRNKVEKQLRSVIRLTLRSRYGRSNAMQKVLGALPESRREKMKELSLDEVLARDDSPLFLLDLVAIVKREWEVFQNVFELSKNKLEVILEDINTSGRPDAHAKFVDKDEFAQLRLHFAKLEEILEDWVELRQQ